MDQLEQYQNVIDKIELINSGIDLFLCFIYLLILLINFKRIISSSKQPYNISFMITSSFFGIAYFTGKTKSSDYDSPPLRCKIQTILTTAGGISGSLTIISKIICVFLVFTKKNFIEVHRFFFKFGFLIIVWLFTFCFEAVIIFKDSFQIMEVRYCMPDDDLLYIYRYSILALFLITILGLIIVGIRIWKILKMLQLDEESEERIQSYKKIFYRCIIAQIYCSIIMICDYIILSICKPDKEGIVFKIFQSIVLIGYSLYGVIFMIVFVYDDTVIRLIRKTFCCRCNRETITEELNSIENKSEDPRPRITNSSIESGTQLKV